MTDRARLPSNHHGRSATVDRRSDAPDLNAWSDTVNGLVALQTGMSLGTMRCPTPPPTRPVGPSSIPILDALVAIVPPRCYGRD